MNATAAKLLVAAGDLMIERNSIDIEAANTVKTKSSNRNLVANITRVSIEHN